MKRSAVALLHRFGLLSAARACQRTGSVILTYHGVLSGCDGNRDDFLNHNFVPAKMFEQHLHYISRYYRPIGLRDLIACYEKGKTPPPRSVAVTFDDGFANNYTVAYPLLRRYGVPFTVFLTTGLIDRPGAQLWTERVKRAIHLFSGDSVVLDVHGRDIRYSLSSLQAREAVARKILLMLKRLPVGQRNLELDAIERVCGRPSLSPDECERYDFLTWHQIREMASAGVEFGSHTMQHPILSTLDAATLQSEIAESKRQIEEALGRPCYAFAYPNGSAADYGEREKRALRAAGYRCALSLRGGVNGRYPDLFQLDRINIGRRLDHSMFQAEVAGVLARGRAVRRLFDGTMRRSALRQEAARA